MELKLHHLINSRSQRILWLLEELRLDYELIIHPQKVLNADAPPHKFPILLLQQSGHEQTLTESSAIAAYLCQQKQALILNSSAHHYWDFCFYTHFSDGSFMPNLALKQVFAQIVCQTPWPVRFVSLAFKATFNKAYLNPEIKTQLTLLNDHLTKNTWLAGDQFSYADILLWFPLHACTYAYPDFQAYNALERYLRQIKSRPAFQAALLKGQWSADEFQRYWERTQ